VGSGDNSKWSSTSSEGEALGDTARELSREEDDAVGWKCLNFGANNFAFLGLEGVDVVKGRGGRASGAAVGRATSNIDDAWGARDE
jgi:hypothetical protein